MEFNCSQCDKCYSLKMSLSNHKRLIHGNPKLHPCTHCDYKAKSNQDCEMHIKSIHKKIKETNSPNLNRHRKKSIELIF